MAERGERKGVMAGLGVLLKERWEMEASAAKIIKKSFVARSLSPRSGSALPSRSNGGFLESCFLCGKRLSLENDVYMYRGDRGFCSVECRCRQILLDEEEKVKRENCSLAASPSRGRERILEHCESIAGGFVC